MDNRETAPVMSMKDWLITLLITCIPMVGFIMLFVWGFSDTANPNKRNWSRAALIVIVLSTVLYFVLIGLIFGAMMASGVFEGL
ncbi:MAG TPA: hypothetical protein DF712_24190 [Balneola sp.]|jgi:ABC-type multidrug transport system permease subunit|nr:hypothetical protein [Bacteroidota bacterium]MAC05702.1 hypothetical protein [Balneola sp.]MAO76598.1 hypothetical protein [Balneola sp.]MBF63732.1 hypothetical protein [Balneola sp.]HAH52026.1 hypothetical protein [Balneola sp.]|tara:strand:+ start:12738 stop:12989 length:252 start_codon:yes stop_codon:yes gene_type:complete